MRNLRERVEEKDKEKKALEERSKSLQKQLANSKVSRLQGSSCVIHYSSLKAVLIPFLYLGIEFGARLFPLSLHASIITLPPLSGEGAGANGQHAAAAAGGRIATEGEEDTETERAVSETWPGGI